eukprot:ANDGO_03398.mRNA.1 hypothetical protein
MAELDIRNINFDIPYKAQEILVFPELRRQACELLANLERPSISLLAKLASHKTVRRILAIELDVAYSVSLALKHCALPEDCAEECWYLMDCLCLGTLSSMEMAQFVAFRLTSASPSMISFLANVLFLSRENSSAITQSDDRSDVLSVSHLHGRSAAGTSIRASAGGSSLNDDEMRISSENLLKCLQSKEIHSVLIVLLSQPKYVRPVLHLLLLVSDEFREVVENLDHSLSFSFRVLRNAFEKMQTSMLRAAEVLEVEQCALLAQTVLENMARVVGEPALPTYMAQLDFYPSAWSIVHWFMTQKADDRIVLAIQPLLDAMHRISGVTGGLAPIASPASSFAGMESKPAVALAKNTQTTTTVAASQSSNPTPMLASQIEEKNLQEQEASLNLSELQDWAFEQSLREVESTQRPVVAESERGSSSARDNTSCGTRHSSRAPTVHDVSSLSMDIISKVQLLRDHCSALLMEAEKSRTTVADMQQQVDKYRGLAQTIHRLTIGSQQPALQ